MEMQHLPQGAPQGDPLRSPIKGYALRIFLNFVVSFGFAYSSSIAVCRVSVRSRMFLRFTETQRSQSSRTVQSCLPLSHVQNSKFVFLRVFRHCLASIWCACKSWCIYRSPLIGFFASSVSVALVFVCRCMLPD